MITRVRLLILLVPILLIATACASRLGPLEDQTDEGPTVVEEVPQVEEEEPVAEEPTTSPEPTDTEAVQEEPTAEVPPATEEESPATEPSEPAEAVDSDIILQDVAVVKGSVCYQEPGESASAVALGALNVQDAVEVLGQSFTNNWIAVYLPATQEDDDLEPKACWVKIDALDLDPDTTALPFYPRSEAVVEEGVEVFDPALASEVIDDVVCLAGPAASYGIVRGLVPGEFVNVIGKGVGNGWFVVGIPNTATTCWLDWDAVDYEGDRDALEIFAAPPK
ncbi:MAG: hypothetical protein DWQ07_23305 [Chloroflexi bacterium]|nr:MAG: hypothetical protein DWQ07_23305 [Chloroflexota bacterium]MBL1194078.1 hypothetical protein [Chloroflexota bacterium]NOH11372.1 hypothetical protein [Chloroflexota bacterium]